VTGLLVFQTTVVVCMHMVALAMLLALWRLLRGPTVPDRILALDTLSVTAIAELTAVRHVPQFGGLLRGRAGDRHAWILQHRGAEQVRAAPGHRRMMVVLPFALSALLLFGCFFILVGALGLVRLSDFFKRLHAPTKASTLGVGCVLVCSVAYHIFLGEDPQPRELLITVFLFITAPVSAHMMAKAALSLMMESRPEVPGENQEAGDGKQDG